MSNPDVDDDYEIESKIPDAAEIQARYSTLSGAVAQRKDAWLDVPYGPEQRHRLDVFPAPETDRPAILFFHGGYWKGGSKESRRFPATAWNQRGVCWVPVEYRLAPEVTLDEIVSDARFAVAWFFANARRYGCEPQAIHVCGNSAGGHIVGMLAATGWPEKLSLPEDVVKSATAISGLFDLAPLRSAFVNQWLTLDEDSIKRNSPVGLPPQAQLPVIVSWGGRESDAFRRQSEAYADTCRRAGADVSMVERPTANHFSIIAELAEPASPLFRAMADRIVAGAHHVSRSERVVEDQHDVGCE